MLLDRHRRAGADLPFGDPAGYHGVAMEGYFWRLSDAAAGVVVIVILAITKDADGRPWGMIGLAAHPGGFVRSLATESATAAPRGIELTAGDALRADARSLRVDLGEDARLDVRFEDPVGWPARRAFGGIGPAQVVPGLSQYWHPWLLGARVRGTATLGDRTLDARRRVRPTPRRTGARAGCPTRGGGARPRASPAARTRASPSPAAAPASAPSTSPRVARRPPRRRGPARRAPAAAAAHRAGEGRWRLRGRTPRDVVEVDGHVTAEPHLLPVPVPGTRDHLDARAPPAPRGRAPPPRHAAAAARASRAHPRSRASSRAAAPSAPRRGATARGSGSAADHPLERPHDEPERLEADGGAAAGRRPRAPR